MTMYDNCHSSVTNIIVIITISYNISEGYHTSYEIMTLIYITHNI